MPGAFRKQGRVRRGVEPPAFSGWLLQRLDVNSMNGAVVYLIVRSSFALWLSFPDEPTTVTLYVRARVAATVFVFGAPPHANKPESISSNSSSVRTVLIRRFWLNEPAAKTSPRNPKQLSGNKVAYTRGADGARNAVLWVPLVLIVNVDELPALNDVGLNAHVAFPGKPEQLNLTGPRKVPPADDTEIA